MGDSDRDSEDEEVAAMARDDSRPEVLFDAKTTVCVCDLRSMCEVPWDLETSGVCTFRALLLPKGKTLHVPGEPGCYVTSGSWGQQLALCKVYFLAATKREPEILLSFSDYGVLNPNKTGTFVITLTLPLLKSRNVYEKTPRHTKISDVAGFSPINEKEMPWSSNLKAALTHQPMYFDINVFSQLQIIGWLKIPLEDRIEKLAKRANTSIVAEVSAISRQGVREGQQRKAALVAALDMALALLAGLPPSKYDLPLAKRVTKLADLAEEQPAWLKTPERELLAQGDAVCRPTTLAQRCLAPSPAAAPAAATVAADVPAAAAPAAAPDPLADPDVDPAAATAAAAAAFLAAGLDGDEGDGAAKQPQGGKRQRNAPNRHKPDEPAVPKPAAVPSKVQAQPLVA